MNVDALFKTGPTSLKGGYLSFSAHLIMFALTLLLNFSHIPLLSGKLWKLSTLGNITHDYP